MLSPSSRSSPRLEERLRGWKPHPQFFSKNYLTTKKINVIINLLERLRKDRTKSSLSYWVAPDSSGGVNYIAGTVSTMVLVSVLPPLFLIFLTVPPLLTPVARVFTTGVLIFLNWGLTNLRQCGRIRARWRRPGALYYTPLRSKSQ